MPLALNTKSSIQIIEICGVDMNPEKTTGDKSQNSAVLAPAKPLFWQDKSKARHQSQKQKQNWDFSVETNDG